MTETSVNPIGSVRTAEPVVPAKMSSPGRTEAVPDQPLTTPDIHRSEKQGESELKLDRNLSNVSIHFQINDETQELTVYVVDRASHHVIRSIPASELGKLKAGDLLKLTA